MKMQDGLLFLGVALGLSALGWIVFFAPKVDEMPYGPVEVTGSVMTASSGALYRVDAWVTLKQPGFITVHESFGGAPGPIVATSMYLDTAAMITSIAVEPLLQANAEYVALLHIDNGDKTFVMNDDLPVMSDGTVVKSIFNAGAAAAAE